MFNKIADLWDNISNHEYTELLKNEIFRLVFEVSSSTARQSHRNNIPFKRHTLLTFANIYVDLVQKYSSAALVAQLSCSRCCRKSLQWFIRRVPYARKLLPHAWLRNFRPFFFLLPINHVRERARSGYTRRSSVRIVVRLTSCKEIRFVAAVGCERAGCGGDDDDDVGNSFGGSVVMRNEICGKGEMPRSIETISSFYLVFPLHKNI